MGLSSIHGAIEFMTDEQLLWVARQWLRLPQGYEFPSEIRTEEERTAIRQALILTSVITGRLFGI